MVYNISNLADKLTSRLWYTFDIRLEANMDDGEYSYVLYDNDNTVRATGLLQVGDYTPNNNTYTARTEGGYVQYNG